MDKINDLLLYLPVLLLSFTVHEFGHAWVALKQGDDTAYLLGRVTLDPRSHIDPVGSILFPILAVTTGAPVLGWARPVPVDPRKLRNYRSGDILVSVAGVAMNAILVIAFTLFMAILFAAGVNPHEQGTMGFIALQFAGVGISVNVSLILFNLLPIPPLDGSKIMYHFLPISAREGYRGLERYGFLILWGLVLTNALDFVRPLVDAITIFFVHIASRAG